MYKTKDIKDAIYNAMVKAVTSESTNGRKVEVLWYPVDGIFAIHEDWQNTTHGDIIAGKAIAIAAMKKWNISDLPTVTEEAFRVWLADNGHEIQEAWQESEYYDEFLSDCLDTYIQEDIWEDVDAELDRIEKEYGIS